MTTDQVARRLTFELLAAEYREGINQVKCKDPLLSLNIVRKPKEDIHWTQASSNAGFEMGHRIIVSRPHQAEPVTMIDWSIYTTSGKGHPPRRPPKEREVLCLRYTGASDIIRSLQVRFKDVESCDRAADALLEWGGFDFGRANCSTTASLRMGRTMTRARLHQPSPLSRQIWIPDVRPISPDARNLSHERANGRRTSHHNPADVGVGSPVLRSISSSQERATRLPLSASHLSMNTSVFIEKPRVIPQEPAQQASAVANAGAETSQRHSQINMAQHNQDVEGTWTTCLQDWRAQIDACFQATKGIEEENKRLEITTSYGREIEARHNRIWDNVFGRYAFS